MRSSSPSVSVPARRGSPSFWAGLSLRESLVVCFSAAFIVISNLFLRIPLHIPGHRVLPIAFFLVLGRAMVRSGWAGTATGLLAGLALLSMGRENPAHVAQYLAAGLITDVVSLIPVRGMIPSVLAGAVIGASWLPVPMVVNRMLGMESRVAIWTVVIKNGWAIAFGAVGGGLAYLIYRRLRSPLKRR